MTVPKVFISYSHDSLEHKAWALKLATNLRKNGVDAILDQWDLVFGQDVSAFMQNGIVSANRVLMICSEQYVIKAEAGVGGVGFERLIVTAEVVQSIDTKKFIPLVRGNISARKIPVFLGPRLYIDFSDDANFTSKMDDLLRELLGAPALTKPPVGPNPFSGEKPKTVEPMRDAGPTGVTKAGMQILSDKWFEKERTKAEAGIKLLGLVGHMELRFGLHDGINKSQIELLTSVRKSAIHTFGWPIGVTLDNNDQYKPRPYEDGIKAEIAIKADGLTGRQSYDYWAARTTGDFYLLQSFFEDSRKGKRTLFQYANCKNCRSAFVCKQFFHQLGHPT